LTPVQYYKTFTAVNYAYSKIPLGIYCTHAIMHCAGLDGS